MFADADARARLEAILHPRIREALLAILGTLNAPYVVLVIPLLVEAGWQDLVDRVLVIDAPESLQRERLMRRDGLSAAEADALLAAQANRATRRAAADDLVPNDGDLDALRARIEGLHRRYLALAGSGEAGPSAG